ncbi:MAG TPA: hypothetical protein DCG75_00600 [Bacteroidales bacterium]|nr:hypothetical protein [Bacteroidales bacterium]
MLKTNYFVKCKVFFKFRKVLKIIKLNHMKRKSFLTVVVISIIVGLINFSCKSDPNKNTTDDIDSQAISDSLLASGEDLVFYSFPSSQEMFSFIKKDAELIFRTDLVNSTENVSNYIDTKSKTFALGIYLADLSYMTLFNKTSDAYKYIEVITKLSSDLRIKLPFQEDFLNRVKNNLNNQDSLIFISDQYSTKIVDYLLQNNKDKTLSNITTASYIEGLYIALNLVDKYSDTNPVIQRIVEQKHSFTNLIKYANKYHNDENTKVAIDLLNSIYEVFEKFSENEDSETTMERGEDNKMILKGGKKIILSEQEYLELKSKVIEIRQKIVENNL